MLSGLDQVPVCVAYDVQGTRHDEVPMTQTEFHHATPVYEYLDGWREDISGAKVLEDLPRNAQAYLCALRGHDQRPDLRGRRRTAARPDAAAAPAGLIAAGRRAPLAGLARWPAGLASLAWPAGPISLASAAGR